MSKFTAELIGTMLLVLLGDGVVANVLLNKSKGQNGGWIVITAGWGFAVMVGAYAVGWISGAHMNPAVTIAFAAAGVPNADGVAFPWSSVPMYVGGQMVGAILGAVLVWLAYLPHWGLTDDKAAVRGVFCTAPAVRRSGANFLTEVIGTFVLLVGVLAIPSVKNLDPKLGFSSGLGPLLVGFLVWSIGLSLGGPTGYAINPARDLGPRIAHFLLPIRGKLDSDWGYAWIPVLGPIVGGIAGALFYKFFWPAM
jgi:glycerol uptake facilitator protein